ncbi:MAG: hypothetical protein HYV27_17185 [Candidatus Hydrogenedentes bacterium]|nr:hypothetical protein [Candidatus Hydrogenedentota bacterium]
MDDLIGLGIFLLIAIVGGISKLREQRNEQKQREERRAQRVRPQDLPEKTRQIFYGSEGNPGRAQESRQAEIPTARPRSAPPAQPVAMPSFGGKEVVDREIPVPPRRKQPTPQPSLTQTLQEAWAKAQEEQRRQMAPQAQRPPKPPEQRQQTHTTMQQMWQQAQQRQPRQAPAPQQRRAQQPQRPASPPVRQVEAPDGELNVTAPSRSTSAPVQEAARRKKAAAERLFSTARNVRYGIMMKEILDPPRALREYSSKF